MTRTLYRIYLYFVLTLLLAFAAGATAYFLGSALSAAGLDGSSNPGARTQLTQSTAIAVVSWVIVLIFGGLHYWLIRRDIAADPNAARGPVRSLFLNWSQLQAALITAAAGASALANIGRENYGSSSGVGIAVAFGGLFTLYQLERRRAEPAPGGALVLQRLHIFGGQLILLFIATTSVLTTLQDTALRLLLATGALTDPCTQVTSPTGYCYFPRGQDLGNAWLATLWALGAWAGYRLLASGDVASRLRAFFAFAGFGYGVIFVLVGIQRGVEALLRAMLNVPDPSYTYDPGGAVYDAAVNHIGWVAPLLFGLLVAVVYWRWLARDATSGGVLSVPATRQSLLAVAATLTAIPFWVACALLLGDIVERNVPDGTIPPDATWATHGGLLVAGLAYIPLALLLRRLSATSEVHAPRRAFVFALLALGTLAGVISLIFVLYALVSQALGSPLDHWQNQARQGTANVVIAALVVVLYGSLARIEGWFGRPTVAPAPAKPETPLPPVPAQAQPLEAILDDLLAGRLTRDQAAAQIRALQSDHLAGQP